jgi:TonB family protein
LVVLKISVLVFLVAVPNFLVSQNTGNPSADSVAVPNSRCVATGSTERILVQDVVGGKLINKVAPKYPKKARRNGIQGVVVICATIGKDGKVRNLRAASGPEELVPAAMDAVKKWRYQPYEVKGEIVEVDTDIRINFKLDPAPN